MLSCSRVCVQRLLGAGMVLIATTSLFVGCKTLTSNNSTSKAYVRPGLLWGENPVIPICLENPNAFNEKGWITFKEVLEREYNQRTPVRFTGFGKCEESSRGIRVEHVDIAGFGPPRLALEAFMGRAIDGQKSALKMNFTFKHHQAETCSKPENTAVCIEAYGLHEVGHALGLAHENERPDNNCDIKEFNAHEHRGLPVNLYITWGSNYDVESIMNYCAMVERVKDKNPKLSVGDASILKALYGTKPQLPNGSTEVKLDIAQGAFKPQFVDLNPIDDLLSNAEHVGLGEMKHGSQAVQALFPEFVRRARDKHGYGVLFFELAWAKMQKLDSYVQGESALSDSEISGILEVAFGSPLTVMFIKELRQYNEGRNPADRFHVAGFDMQHADLSQVLAWLQSKGQSESKASQEIVSKCSFLDTIGTAGAAVDSAFADCDRAMKSARKLVTDSSTGDESSRNIALLTLALDSKSAELPALRYGSADIRGWSPRDKAMADTFERIRTILFPGKKTLLWGHVIHMMKNSRSITYSNVGPFSFLSELESMGTHLRTRLGNKYAVIGSFAGVGSVNFGDATFRQLAVPSPNLYQMGSLSNWYFSKNRFAVFTRIEGTNVGKNQNLPPVYTEQTFMMEPNASVKAEAPKSGTSFQIGTRTGIPSQGFDAMLYVMASL